MNWRYLVGKSFSELRHCLFSSQIMPLTRVVPVGISYPYDIKRFLKGNQVQTIFDVGANIGQTSLFLNRYFPQADIYAFEPVKVTYETFKNNTVNINKIKAYNYALGFEETQKIIRLRDNTELNTLVVSSGIK
ncbi:MAG: FkbM family methyltransferase [Cyanobacteria bacterium P01_D01_bin.50]